MTFDDPLPDQPGPVEPDAPRPSADRRVRAAGAAVLLVAAVAVAIALGNIRRADDWKAVAEGRAERILALERAIATSETDVDELLALVDDLVEAESRAGDLGALATDEAGTTDLRRLAGRAQLEIAACVSGVVDLIDILEGPAGGYDADRAEYAAGVVDTCQTARAAVVAVRDATP